MPHSKLGRISQRIAALQEKAGGQEPTIAGYQALTDCDETKKEHANR